MIATRKPAAGGVTFQHTDGSVEVPDRAHASLAEFREWAGSNDLPKKTRVDYHRGKVWVDMGREQIFTHGLLKTRIATVLSDLVQKHDLGYYWCNGVLVSNVDADLSGNPDGTFVSHESLESSRVVLVEGAEEGFVELEGSVDMVLEVVSAGSVAKDTVELRDAYWQAGIPEYWLVDARGDRLDFQILKRSARGFVEVRKVAGWAKSAAFSKSFKLVRRTDRSGNPTFTLDVK